MAFEAGDHIVYPSYGAGTIIALENRVFAGSTIQYYILKMVADEGEFMVPVDQAEGLGLRAVVKGGAIQRLLRSEPEELAEDYKERQAGIEKLLASSDAALMGIGARDLAWFSGSHPLTGRDIQLYEDIQTQLASELSLAENINLDDARLALQQILSEITEKAAQEKAEQDAFLEAE